MKLALAVALLSSCLANSIQAANISLSGQNLSIFPGNDAGTLLISLLSDDDEPNLNENLTGWQLSLTIEPDPDSDGTLLFDSSSEPPGYILDGVNFGLNYEISTNTLLAIDFNSPWSGGVQIPTNPTPLLNLNFKASAEAQGSFGLFAISGSTEWADYHAIPREFLNLENVTKARLATVNVVAVPEPKSISLLILPLLLLLMIAALVPARN